MRIIIIITITSIGIIWISIIIIVIIILSGTLEKEKLKKFCGEKEKIIP
jgi:hypothetical protein